MHLQEPLQQTVKQIHVAFDALLDIQEVQLDHAAALGLSTHDLGSTQAFMEETALEIMAMCTPPPGCCEQSLLKHLIWKTSNFLTLDLEMAHVSHPYSRVD